MGNVHKGFWKAMGDPPIRHHSNSQQVIDNSTDGSPSASTDSSRIQIELNNTSLYQTIASAVHAVIKVLQFLTANVFHYVSDPVDSSWTGPDVDIRSNTMFSQAEKHIIELLRHNRHDHKHRRVFITGHSLGGSLGTSKVLSFSFLLPKDIIYDNSNTLVDEKVKKKVINIFYYIAIVSFSGKNGTIQESNIRTFWRAIYLSLIHI